MHQKNELLTALFMEAHIGVDGAYEELLHEASIIARNYIRPRLANPAELEDIVQEVLISLHKSRHTYDGQRPFLPWLYAIIRLRTYDHFREEYKKNNTLKEARDLFWHENDNYDEKDVTEMGILPEYINEELQKLTEDKRQILHLLHTEGYTMKEVAQHTGKSESAIKVMVHRMYTKWREQYHEQHRGH